MWTEVGNCLASGCSVFCVWPGWGVGGGSVCLTRTCITTAASRMDKDVARLVFRECAVSVFM